MQNRNYEGSFYDYPQKMKTLFYNQLANQPTNQPDMTMVPYQMMYPEIYYKVQPFVMMAADQMDANGTMLTQEYIEQLADGIYDDVHGMYPDMADYVGKYETKVLEQPFFERFPDRRRFRRRGLFRDIIEILLLQELFRRRRRF